MSTRLTKKQHEILEYIENFSQNTGYSPTYREIMHGLGYKSVATVAKHIDNLVAIGRLEKSENVARSITVIRDSIVNLSEKEKAAREFLIEKQDSFKKDGRTTEVAKIEDLIKLFWG